MKAGVLRLSGLVLMGLIIGGAIGFSAARSKPPAIVLTNMTSTSVIALTMMPLPSLGHTTVGRLTISDAYVQATNLTTPVPTMDGMSMDGMDMSVETSVYLTIDNANGQSDTLLSITTDAAGSALLHQTVVQNNIAVMNPLPNGLPIPANGSVQLKPGGYHIMLSQLKADLVPGQTIHVTLFFQSGVQIALSVPVFAP